jgi:3-deoxy-D-manno-octulosonate 8-phosphate phosphatase (KDO 8-P phosphatase)
MDLLKSFRQVTTFVFDVDGVLTDGTVLLLENGLQARRMNIKDGLALQLAQRSHRVVILSGAYSEPVLRRLQYLGLAEIFLGTKDKLGFLKKYLQEHTIDWSQVLYMGDDLPDMGVLKSAGLACCPADAVPEVKACCHYISTKNGGEACVREVIEKVLKLSGHWHTETDLVSQ